MLQHLARLEPETVLVIESMVADILRTRAREGRRPS